ncbi:scaffolding protein [Arthrobacter phage Vibaki]|uniref:Scaffolding protein n=1 Tax=Arthrobacter phage Vibaki TaxID=2593333 RepID=A0A514TYX0_9CAUD|nr:head maturation protease [Arthrobacter phage Vibaki]QDK01889.1 scaffolding protein [Arthrobacter phage Vibaki]
MTIATTTFKDVQLVKAGTWGGMTGRSTITAEDLADAVAAYADPEIDRGVVKIGHDGDLNLATGHPALGWIENLKLSADKNTLIGDLVDVPAKLAAIVPRAFRRRSVEMSLGVKTPSGKTYRAALTGLALLGAKAPAVKGLDDVLSLYASEGVPGQEDDATRDAVVAFAVEGDTDTAPVPHGPGAGGNADLGSNAPDERTADVALSEALKKKLGLPETATDAEVEAALEAAELAAPAADPEKTPEQIAAEAAAAAAPAGTPAAPAAEGAAALGEGAPATVVVSAVQFAEMQAQLADLTGARAADRKKAALDNAIKTGRIAPAERVAFAASYDKNPEGTETLLSSLAPRFSVIELGDDRTPNTEASDDAELLAAAEAAGI